MWVNRHYVYVLSQTLKEIMGGPREKIILWVFEDEKNAMIRAARRGGRMMSWTKHDSHGICWSEKENEFGVEQFLVEE